MRVLRIFFSAVVTIGVLALVVGLVARELLLYTALGQLRSAARELRFLEADAAFADTCLEYAGLPPDEESLTRLQLRFVSDKDYVLEAVCQGGESVRKVFRQETLPLLVTKVLGQSGITNQQEDQSVVLESFGRWGMVYENEGSIFRTLQVDGELEIPIGQGPATTCEGYGFQCCNEAYQVGEGLQIQTAWDCPLSCYSECAERPVVLAFNSNPATARESRVVTVQSGEELEFFYTVNDIQGDVFARVAFAADEAEQLSWEERLFRLIGQWSRKGKTSDSLEKVVVNFGDGNSTESPDLQGTVFHTSTCSGRSLCIYNATVQAVTREGLTSVLEGVSKIQVQVRP